MKNIFLSCLFLLASCAGNSNFNVYAPSRSKPTCIKAQSGTYKTLEECEKSDSYKKNLESFESESRYYIYDRGYELNVTEFPRFFCAAVYDSGSSKTMSEKSFENGRECANSEEIEKIRNEFKLKNKKVAKENETKRIERIDNYIKNNSPASRFRQTTIDKKIALGMPEELVYLSWGKPSKSNNTVGNYGTHKQLVYGGSNYVYIQNGVVTSWQN